MSLPLSIYKRLPKRMQLSLGFKRYALYFNDVGNYVSIPYSESFNTQPFTIEALVKPTDVTKDVTPFLDHEGPSSGFALRQSATDGAVEVYISDGAWRVCRSDPILENGRWYHVVGLWDDNVPELRIYINGEFNKSLATSAPRNTHTGDLAVGRREIGADRYFLGYIAYVRFYRRVLSDYEIRYNMLNYHNPVRDGLVLWLADRIVGNTWIDESGLSNHGTIYGAHVVKVKQYELRAEVGL